MASRAKKVAGGDKPTIVVEQIDEIILGGVKVQVRGQDLPLESLLLDPTNPRIANSVAASDFGKADAVQQHLHDMLWADPDVHSLYRSIFENGGLIERIIVRSNGVVAEGNCRIVAYRQLRTTFPKDPRWKTIPARVLPAEITERQIATLLGELHVGGKNEWSPFEKAGHIHKLISQYGMVQDEVAKLLRTSKTAVNHNFRAFEVMKEKYLRAFPGPGAVRKFSYFLELFKKPELRSWVTESPGAVDDFVQWVGRDKIARGEHVRELRDIVTNTRALAAFKEHGREAAFKILQRDRPELTSPLFKLMIEMTQAIDDARIDEIQKVRKDKSGGARAIVRNLQESVERFVDLCGGIDGTEK